MFIRLSSVRLCKIRVAEEDGVEGNVDDIELTNEL